ncbi:glycosyltransferase [Lewinellaceae bacterium SD302]|nr:glycosyltransferase [Lewinellaceae bacterium SD302]
MSDTLIVLVKNPIAGKTKTRLAASVGHPKALKMYRILMEYTQQQAAGLRDTERLLLYSDRVTHNDEWPDELYTKGVQEGPGLGERMENAFARAFAEGAERAVIIGSDCPGVTTELLQTALGALRDKDLVIGPALDGGYYLLGMRKSQPTLFRDMNWSTEDVAAETLARARKLGLSIAELVPLSDVDYLEDWEHYGWKVP